MAFSRPSLGDLVARIREDLRTRMGIVGDIPSAVLRRAVVHITATVWAGAVHVLHGHLDWIYRQAFPTLADREALIEYAKRFGDLSPKAATFASGPVTVTGTNGEDVLAGVFLRRVDGERFEVTVGGEIAAGTLTITVEAVNPGAIGNTDTSATLTFESPIPGINSDATVAAPGITGGVDEESTEDFRVRVLDREREPPQGGADHDYVAWALEVPGVTRAWVYPHENGLGTVVVRFVRDVDDNIIPDLPTPNGEVAAVQAKLDEERPVTAEVTAVAPTPLSVDITIDVTPYNQDIEDAINAEIADLFLNQAAPGDGNGQGTIYLSQLQTAVGSAAGVTDFTIVAPAADVVPPLGQIPVIGAVSIS